MYTAGYKNLGSYSHPSPMDPLGTSSSLGHEGQTKKGDVKTTVLTHCYFFCNSPRPFSFTLSLAPFLSSLKEPFIAVPVSTKPLCLQMVIGTISRTVLHSCHSAVTRWHPTSDTRRSPAGDHHSRLFLSLINCYGLASRLSVVLSVFCSSASVTRFTRWDWRFAKASGVHLNTPVFFFFPRLWTFSDISTIPLYFQEQTPEIPLPGCRWSSCWSLFCKRNSVMW